MQNYILGKFDKKNSILEELASNLGLQLDFGASYDPKICLK